MNRNTNDKKEIAGIVDINNKDKIYIAHIGDGEYSFNVFGGAYDDLLELWSALERTFKVKATKFRVYLPTRGTDIIDENEFHIYLNDYMIALITIEDLNPYTFPIND